VMAGLRSSRAALTEHVLGTEHACTLFGLTRSKSGSTGNMVQKLRDMAGHPPKNLLHTPPPPWVADPAEHRRASEAEIAVDERIPALAARLSDARERTKTAQLLALLDKHPVLLAFDSALITLDHFKTQLDATGKCEAIIATGENEQGRRRIRALTQLGS